MKTDRRGWRSLAVGSMGGLFLAVLVATAAVPAQAQTDTTAAGDPLTQATQLYDQSRFDDAVNLLKQALTQGAVTGGDAVKAKELLARAYVKAGNRVEAREVFRSILRQDPEYRADALRMPPDEIEVFNLALKDFQAEQIEAGRRIPASIGFHLGYGRHTNHDLNVYANLYGHDSDKGGTEFGGSVRFPVLPRWSLEVEITSLASKVTAVSPVNPMSPALYEEVTKAQPLIGSVYFLAVGRPHLRCYAFVGGGPMLGTEWKAAQTTNKADVILASRTGPYVHAGVEGEYLVTPRLAVNLRLLGRHANSGALNFGQLGAAILPGSVPRLNGRSVDYRGYAVLLGLRAYVGY
jgi:hypothetical protein